jgi:hypothetical protein
MDEYVKINRQYLTEWAETVMHMNHLGTLVQREIEGDDLEKRLIFLREQEEEHGSFLTNFMKAGQQSLMDIANLV